MADMVLIARIYPHQLMDKDVVKAFEASSRYVPPRKRCFVRRPGERQPTQPPEGTESDLDSRPCIEVRFSDVPRTNHGVIFGSDPNSDVVIPYNSVSWHHFTLTFDDARRFIVKDCGSLVGTEVIYDNDGKGKRSGFQWIVGGDPTPHEKTEIIIKLNNSIQFQIVVSKHDTKSPAYIENVDRFRLGTATTEDLFRDLDFPPETRLHTGAHTPGTGEIHLRKRIGGGSFGAVYHHWNVSTGIEYALKRPTTEAIKKGRFDIHGWQNEAHIMSLISHVRISPTQSVVSRLIHP